MMARQWRICRLLGWALGVVLATAASAAACSISCALSFAPGPVSWLEVAAVLPVAAVVAFVFAQAFRYTWRPGERSPDHIKWRILQEDEDRL